MDKEAYTVLRSMAVMPCAEDYLVSHQLYYLVFVKCSAPSCDQGKEVWGLIHVGLGSKLTSASKKFHKRLE